MTDWATVASVATATGTMVLVLATYASVRSANRSTRIAEKSLELSLQPVLVPSRPEDPPERVTYLEGFAIEAPGGGATIEARDGNLVAVVPLRNVGTGLARSQPARSGGSRMRCRSTGFTPRSTR